MNFSRAKSDTAGSGSAVAAAASPTMTAAAAVRVTVRAPPSIESIVLPAAPGGQARVAPAGAVAGRGHLVRRLRQAGGAPFQRRHEPDRDAEALEPLREPRRIRVDDVAADDLVPDRQDRRRSHCASIGP
jgi:hypothetical protein